MRSPNCKPPTASGLRQGIPGYAAPQVRRYAFDGRDGQWLVDFMCYPRGQFTEGDQAVHLARNGRLEDLDEEDMPDVLLDQAAGIATDLAEMRELQRVPARTAQNRG